MTFPLKTLATVTLAGLALCLTGCSSKSHTVQGYVDADYVYVSPYINGQIIKLNVQRGDTVTAGQALFTLQPQPQLANLQAAQAAEATAEANLKNLQTGERPSELATIEAQIVQAQAQLTYAQKQEQRNSTLLTSNSVSQDALDQAVQNANVAMGLLGQYRSSLTTAKLPAREQQVKAAEASLQQAIAQLSSAQWTYQQTTVTAPVAGQVFDIYHWAGEQAVASQPVLVMLPPNTIKVIFFVPEPALSALHTGETIAVTCESCKTSVAATIRYISPNAEYTPPVIYSRDNDNNLVYRVEAYFTQNPTAWHPGQPVLVTFDNADSTS